ncbi:MAG: calcium/sodium antiporter [Balneolaceae bacterium]|nr:calcium/sodium antiporter [Balneolaceae bacterium]
MTIILFITGLLLLIVGAELLVKGASRIALALKISPLVIGLTVVAFGTSSPELAVSIESSLTGQESITFGTIVGSNIFNVLFILGLSALILPLSVSRQLLRLDVPLMIALSILVLIFSMNGVVSRFEGVVLSAALIGYTTFLIVQSRKEWVQLVETGDKDSQKPESKSKLWLVNSSMVVGGLALLMVGSTWFLDGAVSIAEALGVSETIIGLTIVAAGTSMPEVVTSIMAVIRGEREIAVGNVVGSNIFNILGVLGISAMIAPGGLEVTESFIRFDIPVMIAVALACLPIFFTGGVISRGEGALLLGYYIVYTLYLILASSQHDSLPVLSSVMLWFVIPITIIILVIVVYQQIMKSNKALS